MNETVVDAAILADLAAAPIAPKRRRFRKVHEAQMSFDFDDGREDDIDDEEASETANVVGQRDSEEKTSRPCRSEILTLREHEKKWMPICQSPRRRWGSVPRNRPSFVLAATGTSRAARDYYFERRGDTGDPP